MARDRNVAELDFRLLRIFLVVIESETLSAAADKLKISQPAVSQALVSLERLVGVKILDRTCRPFGLTSAGKVLAGQSAELNEQCSHSISMVQQAARGVRPVVRIGMLNSFSLAMGSKLVKRLSDVCSRVSIWSGSCCDNREALLRRSADIIVSADRIEYSDGIIHSPVLTEPFVLVLPRSKDPLQSGWSLNALASSLPLIEFGKQYSMRRTIDLHLRRCKILPSKRIELEPGEMQLSAIASGLGWGLTTPLCLLLGQKYWDRIEVLPLPKPSVSRTLYQISRREEHQMIAELVWQCSKQILEREVLPKLFKDFSWLDEYMSVPKPSVLSQADEHIDTDTVLLSVLRTVA
jgi:DNA-binding transcriptional LysR family regulator